MKKGIFLCIVFLTALFYSCDLKEDNDETSKKPIFELSLHQYALRVDSVELHKELVKLQEEGNQNGVEKVKIEIKQNQAFISFLNEKLLEIEPPEPLPPLPPPVPCPPEDNCIFALHDFSVIVVSADLKDFEWNVTENGEPIEKEGEPISFPTAEPSYIGYPIKFTKFSENLVFKISKFSEFTGGIVSYSLPAEYLEK